MLRGQSRARVNAGLRLAAVVNCARTGVVDQGSAAPAVAKAAAPAVGSGGGAGLAQGSVVRGCAWKTQGTVQGTDVAHDRGVGLWAMVAVQGLGSARQRNRLRARVTRRVRRTAKVEV